MPEQPIQAVCARLDSLQLSYELVYHPAVYTIAEMEALQIEEQGEIAKNLFLKEKKGQRHFLLMLKKEKRVDLKALSTQLGIGPLTFASAERLDRYLGLQQGAVSPFGLLHDHDRAVEVLIDKDLAASPQLGVHPNLNTATLWIAFADLLQFIEANGNPLYLLDC